MYTVAWLAGLFEGEACFSMSVDKRSGVPSCRIHFESTDLDIVKRVKSNFRGNYYENKAPSKPKHYQRSWRWQLNKKQEVYDLLILIKPYMSVRRRKRINELLVCLKKKGVD